MFGYRNLGFGSHPNRTAAATYTGAFTWSTTLTMGNSNIKSGKYQYGYSTSTMNNQAAIGSLSDTTIDGMWDNDHAHAHASDVQPNEGGVVSLIECTAFNDSGTWRVTAKFSSPQSDENHDQHSNCQERIIDGLGTTGTWDKLTINGVDFFIGEGTYIIHSGSLGGMSHSFGRYYWNASNPFGATSGDFTVTVSSQGWTAV